MKKFNKTTTYYFFLLCATVTIIISILDITGILNGVSWLADRIPTITLLLSSLSLAYLVTERRDKLDSIEEGFQQHAKELNFTLEQIIKSVGGVNLSLFRNRDETDNYLVKRIKSAKKSIDVTHFSPTTPLHFNVAHSKHHHYYETLTSVIKAGTVRVRRVMAVRKQADIQWIREMISEFSNHKFYLGCYIEVPSDLPLISIVIIDDNEVFITGGERNPSNDPKTVAITHPDFTTLIQEHFEALWRHSVKVSERENIEEIIAQFEANVQNKSV